MAEKARELVDEGFRCLKLKVGGDITQDVSRIRSVRSAVGDGIRLVADPNMSYRAKDAIAFVSRIGEFGIDMVAEPRSARATFVKGLAMESQRRRCRSASRAG